MVVVAEFHPDALPLAVFFKLIKQLRHDRVVAVGEDIGLDHDLFADGALDEVAPAVDLRPDRLDDGARWRRQDFFARFIQA
jgi:hypothetical protein